MLSFSKRIHISPPGKNTRGGEFFMEYQEFALGEVTYEIRRVYAGDRSVAELLLDQLTQNNKPNPSFDETHINTL